MSDQPIRCLVTERLFNHFLDQGSAFVYQGYCSTFCKMEATGTFENRILANFGLLHLHPYQKDVISCLLSKKSVFVCQRTGMGKSLCYQAFTTAADRSENMVLVISPLICIMEEQVKYLNSHGIAAVMLGRNQSEDNQAKQGNFKYLYGSPELILGRQEWRKVLKSEYFQQNLALIAVDEAHLVVQW